MNKATRYFAEVRERAVQMVFEHQSEHESQWAAIASISAKIGCTPETLRKWVRRAERDEGKRPGLTTEERERLKALERENSELKRANEILRTASVFFAQTELSTPMVRFRQRLKLMSRYEFQQLCKHGAMM